MILSAYYNALKLAKLALHHLSFSLWNLNALYILINEIWSLSGCEYFFLMESAYFYLS